MIIFLLKIIFCGSALGQLAYWFFVFSKLAFYPQLTNNETLKANVAAENVNSLPLAALSPSVSVVICARNACENLRKNLPNILVNRMLYKHKVHLRKLSSMTPHPLACWLISRAVHV